MGTSTDQLNLQQVRKDHPHACGDKLAVVLGLASVMGSSPRVWGQGEKKEMRIVQTGIIPTRVGTRAKRKTAIGGLEDHPHACGDKFPQKKNVIHTCGSSPRVWGQDYGETEWV